MSADDNILNEKKLKEIEEMIERKKEAIKEKKRERKKELERKEKEKKNFWRRESEKYEKKLETAKKIIQWGEEFVNSQTYKKLGEVTGSRLQIYRGSWGDEKAEESKKQWSEVYLESDGTFIYEKWIYGGGQGGAIKKISIDTPEEMASKLISSYLESIYNFIMSEKVYERIKKEIKSH